MKRFFRWPVLVILAVLVIAAMIPALAVFHVGKLNAARAAGSGPTISLPDIVHPFDTVTITGQGFAPDDHVGIGVDYPGYFIGFLACDNTGNCSGQVTMPYQNIVQGTHEIFGVASSGLVAQTSVVFLPGMTTYAAGLSGGSHMGQGGPGTTMQLVGGGFKTGESVSIYWGEKQPVFLANASGSSFSVTITAPSSLSPGFYMIDAVRTKQTPGKASTVFHILPPRLVSSAGVRENQPAHIHLTGFLANEQVSLSWSAYGNQAITSLTVDATGTADSYVALPVAPKGSYTLEAVGNSSQFHAQSTINIGPGILLSLNTVNPGGVTTVIGGGYTPGETVNVYFERTANGVTPVTVNASGGFSTPLSIPLDRSKNVQHYVYAVSTTTSDKASTPFFYAVPSIQIGCCNLRYGSSFTLTGQEFAGQETVTILGQNSLQKAPVVLGTATTLLDGSFTFTSTIPSVPYIPNVYSNNWNLLIRGSIGKEHVTTSTYVNSAVILSPDAGQIGQWIQVRGGGFASKDAITVQFQSIQVATTTTNVNGGFTVSFRVPTTAQSGYSYDILLVTGSVSGSSSAYFTVLATVKMSPLKGPSGTTMTVKGDGFYNGFNVSMYWFDPATNTTTTLGSITVSGNSFQTTVTAPAGLVKGNTYLIEVTTPNTSSYSWLQFQAT